MLTPISLVARDPKSEVWGISMPTSVHAGM